MADFLLHYLPKLPWTVLLEVFGFLPPNIIYDPLAKVPELRPFIVEHYYRELHLILSPPLRPHFCVADKQKKQLIDIVSYGEIEDFLVDNPDVHPHLVKVITSQDFRSMELLLNTYRGFLEDVPVLHFQIEKYELSVEDMQLLLSFPNLGKLQTSGIKLRKALPAMKGFRSMENLKDMVFLGHSLSNWADVSLPPNLENLDVSWHYMDVTSIEFPSSVVNLYLNQVALHNNVFDAMAFPPYIRTLMLTYNNLAYINVSQLPQSLETIDLSHNNLSEFKYDLNASWPPKLRSIVLHSNLIDNTALGTLSHIEWPPLLENLRLDMNKFTTLEYLRNLPDSLRYLDLSENAISTFEVSHNGDYPYFKFPNSLDTLNLQGSRSLKFRDHSGPIPPENRITFPYNLQLLDLGECNISDLSYFLFPLSLISLSLSGNKISNLTSYNFSMDNSQLVYWEQLEHLRKLELFYNTIDNLEQWIPPLSIREINLGENVFKTLTSRSTPIFGAIALQLLDLTWLNFQLNQISSIDPDLILPPNVVELRLSDNNLETFTFTPALANHLALAVIDLSGNHIRTISAVNGLSNLQELDLSNNTEFSMAALEFYDEVGKMGLEPTKRKLRMRSNHTFGKV